jgi:pentatricopeptide repeat protein
MPGEVVGAVMEDCFKRDDLEMAFQVQRAARDAQTPMPVNAYDSLLKLCAVHGHEQAMAIFDDMQREGIRTSEGLCVSLLSRCADSKYLRFAEHIAHFARSRGAMSLALYSVLMKVYAYCGMFDKACDLYVQIRSQGLEPDAMMYGCLMKFSVACGRTELSQELFEKAPTLDIQNYMSLIRAAGRDHDVDRAFAILEKLKTSGLRADAPAYNCVLDACVSSGDMKRARSLLEQIKEASHVDIIAYNTLLKGYCSTGDLEGAKVLFQEMEQAGFQPNDVSYNCVINAAVSRGAFQEAWQTIDMMERKGVAVDRYTISTMMKALKKGKDPRDLSKALSLLDRVGIDVFSDEVLLNTVLETCVKHRKLDRVSNIIDAFQHSSLRASVHTYGSLIKACAILKRLEKCWQLWQDMTTSNSIEPNNIVLGCMLDALVCNSCVDDAVKLFNEWKTRVAPNTVMSYPVDRLRLCIMRCAS